MVCNHRDSYGNLDYYKEDTTCSTDRGTMGGVYFICNLCDENITEEVYNEQDTDFR